MADLKVHILGHDFKNPVIMSSGVFGYGREYEKLFPLSKLGGLATKGTTLHKRNGNDGPRIAETSDGLLFSVGLQNPGIDHYIKEDLPYLLTKDTNVLTNVAALSQEEYLEIIEKLEETDAPIIELNISCPNLKGAPLGDHKDTAYEVTKKVRAITKKPLCVKLSPNVGNIAEIAMACEDAGADAVSLVNSISGMKINLRTGKPFFNNKTAGYSGHAIFHIAERMVWQVANAVNIPVIGIGGITSGEDAIEMMMAGASAVEVGSAIFKDPYAPIHIIDGMNKWLDDNGKKSVTEIIGTAVEK